MQNAAVLKENKTFPYRTELDLNLSAAMINYGIKIDTKSISQFEKGIDSNDTN